MLFESQIYSLLRILPYWRNKKQKKAPVKNMVTDIDEVETDDEADDVIVTDEVAELPEADVASSVVRKTKKAKS